MASIKPFRALHPNPFYADKLVFPGDEQVIFIGVKQDELPLLSLKEQLEAPARRRPETEEGQQQGYREIGANLRKLIELDRLRKDERPGIYIYEIVRRGYRQAGVWALTDLSDLSEGKIKLHELTLADSERRIRNYRESTGLEGTPVLLTYRPSVAINRIIAETCAGNKKMAVGNKKSLHRVWKIEDPETLKHLIAAFKAIGCVYLADGHHRLGAAKGRGRISSLYIATDQLRICEYYRVVIPETKIDTAVLLAYLSTIFHVSAAKDNLPVRHMPGLCAEGQWFELEAREAGAFPMLLLQEQVLAPFFGITDPRTDRRLKYIGGEAAMEETLGVLHAVPEAIAFTLCALSADQLIAAADSGTILPPKSTWIDPKVPYGLLLARHRTATEHFSLNHYD